VSSHHQHGHPVPLDLLRHAADAALTGGDGTAGEALLVRAMAQAEAGQGSGATALDQARVIAERARHLTTRDPGQAEELARRACQLFTTAGSEAEAAAATRLIADIAYQRGDYDEALRIRRETELPVYERLGDTRSAAVTWGKIADIGYQRGEFDQAADLQRKRLEVNRQLRDADGIAAASWDLAQIDLQSEDYESALPRLMESFEIFSQLQRPDGLAVVGRTLGQLLIAADAAEQARDVLSHALAAAVKIGQTDLATQINDLLTSTSSSDEDA